MLVEGTATKGSIDGSALGVNEEGWVDGKLVTGEMDDSGLT